MEEKLITFVVTARIRHGDGDIGDWQRKARQVRSVVKTALQSERDIKILKIDSKEERLPKPVVPVKE